MRPDELRDRLNLVQKYALVLVQANDRQPVRGKLWFQKEMFVLSKAIPDLSEELAYEPSLMGAMSDALEWNVDQLEGIGLIEKRDSAFAVTAEGGGVVDGIEPDLGPAALQKISEVKKLLNELSKDELLAFVYFLYPDMTVESEELAGVMAKRKDLAVSLFSKGKVGLERGALIAGLAVQDFAALLGRRRVSRYSE